jgi:hypothetical protein
VFGQSYPDGYGMGTETAVVQLCMVDSVHLGSKFSTVHQVFNHVGLLKQIVHLARLQLIKKACN